MTPGGPAATDTMRRRIPLALCGRFALFGRAVVINTNCEAILQAASTSRLFVPVGHIHYGPAMQWEVVGSLDTQEIRDWECNVTLAGHSLYLSMGPQQWFALDLETHEGAGFVAMCSPGPAHELNIQQYFESIAYNVGASLGTRLGSCYE